MKTNTTPFTRNWASASSSRKSKHASLWFATLATLTILAPAASAAVSITPTVDEPECVVFSGLWTASVGLGRASDIRGEFEAHVSVDVAFGGGEGFQVDVVLRNETHGARGVSLGRTFGAPIAFPVDFSFNYDEYLLSVHISNASGESATGSYRISEIDCEPNHGVPDTGSSFALFACGLGAIGGVRRVMAKRQRA